MLQWDSVAESLTDDMLQEIEVAEYPLLQADQGFLNLYFGGTCMRLPYIYNANLAIKDRSPILWQRLTDEMRVVHYTTMKPFIHEARSSNAMLTPEEIEEAVDKSERQADGFYHEEVGWWRTAYRNMMSDRGHVIRQCYQS
jgi:glycogenin glucosyltransferase